VIIYLADDLSYREVVSVTKSMESLSLIAGASAPQLNEIQISLRIETPSNWKGAELGNMISVNIPRNVADILPELFPINTKARQSRHPGNGMEGDGSLERFSDFLGQAGFTAHEQKIAAKNLTLHHIAEGPLMLDLGIVTRLVKTERIHFKL
jgi:hypothetical protein